ncbi:hypothetical protein B484DRAFT_397578, partial [Ochromonadaceae sp. CCMP2298]
VSDTFTKYLQECLARALTVRREFEHHFISIEHLLLSTADTNGFIKTLFADIGGPQKLRDSVSAIRGSSKRHPCEEDIKAEPDVEDEVENFY